MLVVLLLLQLLLSLSQTTAASVKEPAVFVTGAAGFIGSHLMVNLKKNGFNPIGLDNFNSYYSVSLKRSRADYVKATTGSDIIDGELCDADLIHSIFNKYDFTHIINLAAQPGVRYSFVNPMQYVEFNVECFTQLLEAIKTEYVEKSRPLPRFLYASSSSVYGLNKKIPFSEEDPVDTPSNLYGATKAANELIAHSYHHLYGITTIGFRFFTVYGPFGRPDMAASLFTEKIVRNEPVTLFDEGEMQRDFTYVDDIVRGVTSAVQRIENDQNIVYNLGNTHPVKTGYFLSLIEKNLNKKANYVHKKSKGEMAITFSNITLARQNLHYLPQTSIEDGIERFVQWYKDFESSFNPCSSACSYDSLCFKSGWDEAAEESRRHTASCSVVFYTINTPVKADTLHMAPNATRGCNIAFIHKKSTIFLRESKTNHQFYNNWILVPVNALSVFPDPRKATRLPKIVPDTFFAPSVRYAIYGDSSIILRQDPQTIVDKYSREGTKIAVLTAIRHPYSKTIAEEVQAVLTKTAKQNSKVTHYPAKLMEQNKAYESLRRVEKGLNYVNLFDGSFLVHQLQSPEGKIFRCRWYREYQEWADRDQVPGAFVVNKMTFDYSEKFLKKKGEVTVKKKEWLPIIGSKGSVDGQLETSYVHILDNKFHPWRSREIILKEKFQYAYK
jgi:UDP-glucuronate 4-epimerase